MSSTPSGFSAFFAELRRRRVFRVAAVYAVVAWLITQIAATTFPHLNLPGWMITAVIVLVALGFPIALVLAWAFDLTPEGVVRAEPRRQASEADASPRRWTGQRIAALGGAVILALAGGAFVPAAGGRTRYPHPPEAALATATFAQPMIYTHFLIRGGRGIRSAADARTAGSATGLCGPVINRRRSSTGPGLNRCS